MIKHFKIIFLLCLTFFFSCDFGKTNLDPTRPSDAELKEILPTALTQTAHNLTSIGARVTGIVVQHFDGIDAQPEGYAQYLIDERTLDELWQTGLFAGAMKDCDIIMKKAEAAEQHYYNGIAKTLMAINLGIATSFWGEVPYEEAFQGLENLFPKYESQKAIYEKIQKLLQEAIEGFQNQAPNNPPQADDLIFQGDVLKWIATAKALQARYYLQLSKQETELAQQIITIIQSGAFQMLEEQPNFPFGNNLNEANPLPLYWFERPDQMVMSDYLYELLDNTNDPRLTRMAIMIDGVPHIYRQDSLQLYWGQFDVDLPLISLTEIKFIEAEAHLRLNSIEAAETAFKEAVTAHFEQMEIPFSDYESFLGTLIHFDNHPTFEAKLEWLIQQKHIALFGQNANEAWIDFRRTGFPSLIPPSSANPSFNPSLVIPKRYLYPISERTSNQNNFTEAIQRQGGHLMDIGTWAFE